jgi:enoyl-CoA hydratase/carnithine racemase
MALAPLSLQALRDLAKAPASASGYSALAAQPFILLETRELHALPADAAALRAWFRELPCPAIGLGPLSETLTDTTAGDEAEAQMLADGIRRAPLAAATFAQLLRVNEHLPLSEALTAESLAYATLQGGPEFRRWLSAQEPAKVVPNKDPGPAVLMRRIDDTLTLELNRPSTHNAMSVEMRDALVEALTLVLMDASIRRLHISGLGKCFSTGGELAEFGTVPDPATAHLVRSLALPGRLLAACADRAEAELHGACIGSGIEFPAFAARVAARSGSWFQLPELSMGLIPGAGGCVSIARRIGRQRCAWMVFSGRRIDTLRAKAWGLVDRLL